MLNEASLRKISTTGIPEECVLAVFLWRNPYQPIFNKFGHWYVYLPVEQCFYCNNPNNSVRNDWQRARGMDDYLKTAMKYFPDLCMKEDKDHV